MQLLHLFALDACDGDVLEGSAVVRPKPQLLPQSHPPRHHRAREHAPHAPHLKRLIHLHQLCAMVGEATTPLPVNFRQRHCSNSLPFMSCILKTISTSPPDS